MCESARATSSTHHHPCRDHEFRCTLAARNLRLRSAKLSPGETSRYCDSARSTTSVADNPCVSHARAISPTSSAGNRKLSRIFFIRFSTDTTSLVSHFVRTRKKKALTHKYAQLYIQSVIKRKNRVRLHMRLHPTIHAALAKQAKRQGLTVTWIVEHALKDYLARK